VKNRWFLNISESVYVNTTSIVAPIAALYIKTFTLKPDKFDAKFNQSRYGLLHEMRRLSYLPLMSAPGTAQAAYWLYSPYGTYGIL
jgi:hypothetical protein